MVQRKEGREGHALVFYSFKDCLLAPALFGVMIDAEWVKGHQQSRYEEAVVVPAEAIACAKAGS